MARIRKRTTRRHRRSDTFLVASQQRLMWWRFRRHRMALVSAGFLLLMALVAVFCEFVAPADPRARHTDYIDAPPQPIRFLDEKGFHPLPFLHPLEPGRLDETWTRVYEVDRSQRLGLRLFVRGDPYRLWGLFESDIHLFGLAGSEPLFLLGTDHLGRDLLSRVIYGTRVSLSIAVVGVTLSLLIGCVMGGISGYASGFVDEAIQRLVEALVCIPTIPLWMGLGAALPANWPPLQLYFGMVIILSLVGWAGTARAVRGKVISLRDEDFVTAARLAGARPAWLIRKHLLPAFFSYIIVSATLAVPGMILAETTLSYLGIGLQPPVVSWGVLLQPAQSVQAVAKYPWILTPGVFLILVVLAFNFVGDGLRDAADPYSK